PHDLDVPLMAGALGGLLDAMETGPVVLVGQSMGTQWVVELAARRPDLTRAVVLIGPVADEHRRTVLQQTGSLALDTLGEPPGANVLVFTDYLRCGPRWYLTQLRPMRAYAIADRIVPEAAPALRAAG